MNEWTGLSLSLLKRTGLDWTRLGVDTGRRCDDFTVMGLSGVLLVVILVWCFEFSVRLRIGDHVR